MDNRRSLPPLGTLDRLLCAAVLFLLFFGLITLYSISSSSARFDTAGFQMHVVYMITAFFLFVMSIWVPLALWRKYMPTVVIVALILCVWALQFEPVNGASRWVRLGSLTIQVAEVVKFSMLVACACWGKTMVENNFFARARFSDIAYPMMPLVGLFVLVAVLLLLQRDFGTLALLLVAVSAVFLLAGLPWRHVALLLLVLAVVVPLLIISESYRVDRLLAFIDPFQDPRGKGYAQLQSLLAFGSGGWFGTGAGSSAQKYLVPEVHNDFISAVIAEEYGWVTFFFICMAYLLIALRLMAVAGEANRRNELFGAFYAYGLAVLLLAQATVNIGGSLSVLPSKGLTLPLVSAGGTSLCMTALMLGVAMRIDYENKRAAWEEGL